MRTRWTKNQAWEWYFRKKWVMGVNYVPSVTLHAVELWQEDTHAEAMQSVRKEIALMEDIGINGVRMFLPFSVWYHDREKFLDRFDHVLDELSAHGVTMMPSSLMTASDLLRSPTKFRKHAVGRNMTSVITEGIERTTLSAENNAESDRSIGISLRFIRSWKCMSMN